ncbi:hypothetical protein GCM10020295_15800 [Streptomyces cinereospinus]
MNSHSGPDSAHPSSATPASRDPTARVRAPPMRSATLPTSGEKTAVATENRVTAHARSDREPPKSPVMGRKYTWRVFFRAEPARVSRNAEAVSTARTVFPAWRVGLGGGGQRRHLR